MLEKIKLSLKRLLEEVYEVSYEELPSFLLNDIAIYAEATRNNVSRNKWRSYVLKRDRTGFTAADDKLLELLLNTEKVFNITIKDEEAEKVYTLNELELMVSKKVKDKNRRDYFEQAIHCKKVKLILMGQDPYPDGNDNGIAFCKNDLSLLNKTCFPNICISLGIAFNDDLKKQYDNNGIEFFKSLLENGVVFMNLSYELLDSVENIQEAMKYDAIENHSVIADLKKKNPEIKLIRLGKNHKKVFMNLYGTYTTIEPLLHPASRAASNKKNSSEWKRTYRSDYLKRLYLI
jgi:uracil DNA glycosylase